MAYRKTETILAGMEARKGVIIAATIDLISKTGVAYTDDIAARAEVATGLIYKYFADRAELDVAVIAKLLASDLAAIREATADQRPVDALTFAIAVLYGRFAHIHLVHLRASSPNYYLPIREELVKLMRASADMTPNEARIAAGAALGAIFGAATTDGSAKKSAQAVVQFVLRGIGFKVKVPA